MTHLRPALTPPMEIPPAPRAWATSFLVAASMLSCGGASSLDGGDASACAPPNDTGGPSLAPDSLTNHCGRGPAPGVCPAPGQPAYGQDGNYRIRVPTYTAAPSTVSDSVTTLTWQRTPSALVTADQAAPLCEGLSLDGVTGFRLPTRLELVTILDYGTQNPAMSPPFVIGSPGYDGCSWSTSVHGAFGAQGSVVCAESGLVATLLDGSMATVRCVAGAGPAVGYQVMGDTTFDLKTGLQWARDVPDGMTWDASLAYCAALRTAGACDWRMPSVKELLSIVEDNGAVPPVDAAAFPGTPSDSFWTSTVAPGPSGNADVWGVLFQDDLHAVIRYQAGTAVTFVTGEGTTGLPRVRCVR